MHGILIVDDNLTLAMQLEERLSMTVLPFEQKGEVSGASLSFQDNLTDGLVNRNRFRMVERNKLDTILQEQIKHPVTGKVLGSDNEILGRARVVQVMPGMS
ncbi:MAG TPA: hypothetical protein HPP59_04955, partial [Deltaproteobacteria bacterium]|nr:hypothetical protein [Deltaproteobacteria bacterium]